MTCQIIPRHFAILRGVIKLDLRAIMRQFPTSQPPQKTYPKTLETLPKSLSTLSLTDVQIPHFLHAETNQVVEVIPETRDCDGGFHVSDHRLSDD